MIANYKAIGIPIKIKENKQLKEFTFSNGSEMGFHGTRDILNVHGLKQDIAWENEVMEITYQAHKQIAQRTSERIYMDFNPSFNHHWVFDKIMSPGMMDTKTHYIHSTYRDNSFLSYEQVDEIEQYDPSRPENVINGTASQWHWDVYGLGKRGKIEGVIFPEWEIVPDSMLPPREACVRWGGGLDFGYHPDPAALIEPRLFQDCLWLQERMYETDLIITKNQSDPSYPSIQLRLEQINWPKHAKIYADCAQPASITDLRLAGYNIQACTKGPDSIVFGINLIKSFRVLVAESSLNLQKELEHYRWAKDSTGGYIMGKPVDTCNHCFVAGTAVTTKRGEIPIEQLLDSDLILTRSGYRPMRWHGFTKVAEIWEVKFNNGVKLRGTAKHKIFTDRGDICIDSLRYGDRVLTNPTKEKKACQQLNKHTKGKSTANTWERSTIREVQKDYTGSYGKKLMERFQRGLRYITSTSTRVTTTLRTWNALLGLSTGTGTKEGAQTGQGKISITSGTLLKSGTAPQKERNGTLNRLKSLSAKESHSPFSASNVGRNTRQRITATQSSALTNAKANGGGNQASTTKKDRASTAENYSPLINTKNEDSVHVVAVRNTGKSEPTYNLEVEEPHEYYAHGVLVHNCIDPLRYWTRAEAFMYRESIKSMDEQKRQAMPRRRKPQTINRVRQ